MKRKKLVSLILCLVMLLGMLPTALAAPIVQTWYVDGSVQASGDGKTEATAFKTIQEAANKMTAGDTCIIAGGIYRETIKPQSSGTEDAPMTFKAKEGEKVVVSGADVVTGWQKLDEETSFEGASEHVYVAHFKDAAELAMTTTPTDGTKPLALDVYVENTVGMGQQMNQARWPNMCQEGKGPFGEALLYDKLDERNYGRLAGGGLTYADLNTGESHPDDYWKGATVLYSGSNVQWTAQTSKITGSQGDHVTFEAPLAKEWHRIACGGSLFYVFDKLEELDMQTEWHYDVETGNLYFWAPGNADLTAANAPTISVKQRKWGFDLEGKSWINLQGIDVMAASANLENAHHCTIDQCDFKYVAVDPWVYYTYSRGGFGDHGTLSPWWDSSWVDVGVYLGGSYNTLMRSTVSNSFGDCVTVTGEHNTVKNCVIKNSNSNLTECGGLSVIGKNHDILANRIYSTGRSALQFNFVEGSRMMYNDIYGSGRISHDLGIAYCYITDGKGTEIAYNWIHDNLAGGLGAGIYLDNSSSNFLLHHNVTWNTYTMEGVVLNGPTKNHQVYNNTIINCSGGAAMRINGAEQVKLYNNLCVAPDKSIGFGNDVQNNICLQSNTDPQMAGYQGLTNNQLITQVEHNLTIKGDSFAIEAGSPAQDRGMVIDGITTNVTDGKPDAGAYEAGQEPWVAGENVDVSHLNHNNTQIHYPELRRYNNTAPELKFDNKWYYKPEHGGAYYFGDSMVAGENPQDHNHKDSKWVDVGDDIGATMTMKFSGESIKVYGTVGPYFGKTQFTVTKIADQNGPIEHQVVDQCVFDGYSDTYARRIVTYENNNLNKNYTYELRLVTLDDKNANSTGYAHVVDEVQVFTPKGPYEAPDYTKLHIQGKASMGMNETQTVTVEKDPAYAAGKVFWEISDATIASMDKDGNLKAYKGGTITVKAMSMDQSVQDSFEITIVQSQPESITVTGPEQVEIGLSTRYGAVVEPATSAAQDVTWIVNPAEAGTVKDGVFTAKNLGEATIQATAKENNQIIGVKKIQVVEPVPQNGVNNDRNLALESACGEMRFDQFGNAYEKMKTGADGNATDLSDAPEHLGSKESWWGYGFDKYYTFNTFVYNAGPCFVDGGWFINPDGTTPLKIQTYYNGQWVDVKNQKVTPDYAYDNTAGEKTYTFTFDDAVGTKIRMIGKPYCHAANNFTFTSVGKVEVYNKYRGDLKQPTKLEITGGSSVSIGKNLQLQAVYTPDDVTVDKAVVWSSSKTDVAEIDQTGLVTAKAIGKTTITLKAANAQDVAATMEVTVTEPAASNEMSDKNFAPKAIGVDVRTNRYGVAETLRILTDGIKTKVYSSDDMTDSWPNVNQDSYKEDHWGLMFPDYLNLNELVYTAGQAFADGGWFINPDGKTPLKVQYHSQGQWHDVTNQKTVGTEYPYDKTAGGKEGEPGVDYRFHFDPVVADGIRITGKPFGLETTGFAFTSISELEVYYKAENVPENVDQEKADAVMNQIHALPNPVTLESKEAIEAARAAYNALTDAQKKLVKNLDVLEAAEQKLAELKEDSDTPVIPPYVPHYPVTSDKPAEKPVLPFTDVVEDQWYYESVQKAFEENLINGMDATHFEPDGTLTVAQTIKLAAVLHQRDKLGKVTLENGTQAWFSTYVNYAIANGIIDESYGTWTGVQMNKAITRTEFVKIFHGAKDYYASINEVADNSIPDVKMDTKNAEEIYEFYRAGILNGSDEKGTFYPDSNIKRSEVATILVRMYDVSARIGA